MIWTIDRYFSCSAFYTAASSFLLGRESKRKIVLTHPIEVEGETGLSDAGALHDTPPNVNQYHQYHIKNPAPKSNNNRSPQRFDQQLLQQQQQSRALIHADERKTTTTHAGHTPRSDRRRKDRKHRTGSWGVWM